MEMAQVQQMNCLHLAFLGDSIFTFRVREYIVKNSKQKLNNLNILCNKTVCAPNQARLLDALMADLTETELDIAKRARNIHTKNIAKNSTYEEYSKATQYEALLGYWYLTDQNDKIDKYVDVALKEIDL